MKHYKIVMVCLLFLAGFSLLGVDIQNIGHRGSGTNKPSNPLPENTIPSFEQAVLDGADMIELDVLLTADDELVVIHDDTLDRTTDCTGRVFEKTMAELATCDAAAGTPLEGTGVTLPTLADVFDAIAGPINVEIKSDDVGSEYTAAHIAQRVQEVVEDAEAEDRVVISSFSMAVCEAAKAAGSSPVAYLTSELNVQAQIDAAVAAGLDGIHPTAALTFKTHVDTAREQGLFVNVWTVDGAAAMNANIAKGVDGIITNEPEVLAGILDPDDDDDDDDNNDDNNDNNDNDDTSPADDDTADDDDNDNDDNNDNDSAEPTDSDDDDDNDDPGCGC